MEFAYEVLSLLAGATLLVGMGQPALAQDADAGKTAGSLMAGLRGIGVLPQTSISPIGGHIEASDTAAPEIDASYFFTDNIAVEAIAATTRHHITAHGTTRRQPWSGRALCPRAPPPDDREARST